MLVIQPTFRYISTHQYGWINNYKHKFNMTFKIRYVSDVLMITRDFIYFIAIFKQLSHDHLLQMIVYRRNKIIISLCFLMSSLKNHYKCTSLYGCYRKRNSIYCISLCNIMRVFYKLMFYRINWSYRRNFSS